VRKRALESAWIILPLGRLSTCNGTHRITGEVGDTKTVMPSSGRGWTKRTDRYFAGCLPQSVRAGVRLLPATRQPRVNY
jgi:hypothetical protein